VIPVINEVGGGGSGQNQNQRQPGKQNETPERFVRPVPKTFPPRQSPDNEAIVPRAKIDNRTY